MTKPAGLVSSNGCVAVRGLDGIKLVAGNKCLGIWEAVREVFPKTKYQRCTVHFYRNVFSITPRSQAKLVVKMLLRVIHAQKSKKVDRQKAKVVVEELRSMKIKEVIKKSGNGIKKALTYCEFPSEHWTRIHTNNGIEMLNRKIRHRTHAMGSFSNGKSTLS